MEPGVGTIIKEAIGPERKIQYLRRSLYASEFYWEGRHKAIDSWQTTSERRNRRQTAEKMRKRDGKRKRVRSTS